MNPHVTKSVQEILNIFHPDKIMDLYNDFVLLFEMCNTSEDDEQELQSMCQDDINLLRLVRTAYALSIIAEKHGYDLRKVADRHPKFYQLCDSIADKQGL